MRGALRDRIPFAVVGANTFVTNSAGNRVRARTYPWGTVEVENVEHNDFAILSYYLIQLQMQVCILLSISSYAFLFFAIEFTIK